MFAAIQHINNFTLPPVLVGGICKIIALALATKYAILAKANKNNPNLFPRLKLEVIKVLELHRLDSYKCFYFHTKTWRTNF